MTPYTHTHLLSYKWEDISVGQKGKGKIMKEDSWKKRMEGRTTAEKGTREKEEKGGRYKGSFVSRQKLIFLHVAKERRE